MRCLEDENVFVRRAAVNGVIRLFNISPSFFLMHNNFSLVDKMKSLVEDRDGVVMVNSLLVVDELMRCQNNEDVVRDGGREQCDQKNYGDNNDYSNNDNSAIESVNETKIRNLVITKSLVMHLLTKFKVSSVFLIIYTIIIE